MGKTSSRTMQKRFGLKYHYNWSDLKEQYDFFKNMNSEILIKYNVSIQQF